MNQESLILCYIKLSTLLPSYFLRIEIQNIDTPDFLESKKAESSQVSVHQCKIVGATPNV